jgi:hypothetical protein
MPRRKPRSAKIDPTFAYIKRNKLIMTIARKCGINRQAISQWAEQIPYNRVLVVSEVTGLAPHLIRPDIYPPPPDPNPTVTSPAIAANPPPQSRRERKATHA